MGRWIDIHEFLDDTGSQWILKNAISAMQWEIAVFPELPYSHRYSAASKDPAESLCGRC